MDALIQNLQTQIDGLTPLKELLQLTTNNKTYSSVSCEGFCLDLNLVLVKHKP